MAVADLLHANRMEHISDIGLQSATPEASARELRLSAIALNCDGLRTVVDRESCWRFELELQVRMAEDAPIDHALLGVIVIDGSIERIQEHVAVPRLCGSARRLAPGTGHAVLRQRVAARLPQGRFHRPPAVGPHRSEEHTAE